jgi:hypothetical protein
MASHTLCKYTGISLDADQDSFQRCHITDCELFFNGSKPPEVSQCRILRPRLKLSGPAENTIRFLAAIYHSGGADEVEEILEKIRKVPPGS